MPEFSGSACVVQWIWSGGTVTLSGDYRNLSLNPSINLVDSSAGSDARINRLATQGDFSASLELVAQTGGTAVLAALAAGVQGTLIAGPEGTATGKPKTTASCFSGGARQQLIHNEVSLLSVEFTGDGVTYSQGAY